jgi:hypothetical protein
VQAEIFCRRYLRRGLLQSHCWRTLRDAQRHRRSAARRTPVAAAPPVAEGWLRRRRRLLRPLRRAEAKARADSPVPLEPAQLRSRCDRVRRRLAPRRRRLLWSRRSSQQRSRSRSFRRLLLLRQGLPLAAGAPRPTRRSLERLLAAVHRGQQPAAEHRLLGADGPNPWHEAGSGSAANRRP